MRWSDRIFGLAALALGVAYALGARAIETPFAVDPLGPRTFPVIVGTTLALTGLWPLLVPDPEPDWPRGRALAELAGAVAILLAYTVLLEPLGFVPATVLAAALLAWRLGGSLPESALFALLCAVGLRLVFVDVLELSLPRGLLGW